MIAINEALITTWLLNTISNVFAGLGIAIGVYFAFKKLMPKWIMQITQTLKEQHTIDKAISRRSSI